MAEPGEQLALETEEATFETEEAPLEPQETSLETQSTHNTYRPPSVHLPDLLAGRSYSHFSPIPSFLLANPTTEYVMGVDEAGRGPVLGPMVYSVFYAPRTQEIALLKEEHHFTDSKLLGQRERTQLMQQICAAGSSLHAQCGWASRFLSARDIGAGMFAAYNLNAQAVDATVALVRGVLDKGVRVVELFVDTIGQPEPYQRRLEKIFPTLKVTVAKKADLLYPCVSAASITAKVGRDAALEALAEEVTNAVDEEKKAAAAAEWGSGYPSDARCVGWMEQNMNPVFGWGSECRFSWGTAVNMLEGKPSSLKVDWANGEDDDGDMKMTSFFSEKGDGLSDELGDWYGKRVGLQIF